MDPEFIRARRAEDDLALDEIYDTYPELFTIHLYHGGYFTDPPDRVYLNDELDFFDLINIDKFGMQELEVIKSRLGYTDQVPHFFHFSDPHGDLDTGLYRLTLAEDFLKLAEFVRAGDRFIDVYMEHGCSNVIRYSQSQCSEVLSLCWHENGETKGNESAKANEDTGDNQTGYHVRLDNLTGDNQTGEHNANSADPGMEYSKMFDSLDDFEPFMDSYSGSKEKHNEKHSLKDSDKHNVEHNDKNVDMESADGEHDSEEDNSRTCTGVPFDQQKTKSAQSKSKASTKSPAKNKSKASTSQLSTKSPAKSKSKASSSQPSTKSPAKTKSKASSSQPSTKSPAKTKAKPSSSQPSTKSPAKSKAKPSSSQPSKNAQKAKGKKAA